MILAQLKEVFLPDIGSTGEVTVIEVAVKPGDKIKADQTIVTLESEKATMEIPAPEAGVVDSVAIKVGSKVKTGSLILKLTAEGSAATKAAPAASPAVAAPTPQAAKTPAPSISAPVSVPAIAAEVYASPGVRRFARELGVDLNLVAGSARKNRIQKEDVQAFLNRGSQSNTNSGAGLPTAPVVDFSKFGEIETKPLTRIKKLTGINLHRNWLIVPHVTQFEEADITELEVFRKSQSAKAEKQGYKLTPLVFIMKAVVSALKTFPQFNASLDPSGENLIVKKYFHIGVAVDTPEGLVVPVIRDVDKKGLFDLVKELAEISEKARNKNLLPADMQGASFTISSLGGIGGTAFTPIVNVPDVAILGVSKSVIKPVYQNDQFVPRLMLPLSLSYDHRVIDGADGARFIVHIAKHLSDIRQLLF